MKINLRRFDVILIAGLAIMYLAMLVVESLTKLNIHSFLGPLLILVFVIIYLQTIRSLEAEFKKVKQASKKEILKSIDEIEGKLEETLPLTGEIKDVEALLKSMKKVEEHVINEIKNSTDNLYFQLDSLISINKVLEEVRYPMPPYRGWAISPDFGRNLMLQLLKWQPEIVYDLGSGISSLISGYCMKIMGKGKVISLDHNEQYYSLTKDNIKFHGLDKFVEVTYAPLKNYMVNNQEYQWYDLNEDLIKKPIDLIIVDGPPGVVGKKSRYPAIPILSEYMNDGCIVLVDDYLREDEKDMVDKWISEFGLEIISLAKAEKGYCALRYKKR